MPILAHEPSFFPETLFAGERSDADAERKWWVLHTLPRQEKSTARELHRLQAPFYLPLFRQRNLTRGRVVTSFLPLFTGYVFLHGSDRERQLALGSGRLVRTLPVTDQDLLWHDLAQLHRLIESGLPVTPEERLGPGSQVKIRSGVFTGFTGRILETKSGRRFVVQVNFLQRGASVMLDDFQVAPDDTR
jgi:transcriptional antiterminator RfaH